MKILATLFVLALTFATAASFAVSRDLHHVSGHSVVCHLRPGQAAELEACAYELMRDFNTNKMHDAPTNGVGPMAWLNRRVFARTKSFPPGYLKAKAKATGSTRFSSEQP